MVIRQRQQVDLLPPGRSGDSAAPKSGSSKRGHLWGLLKETVDEWRQDNASKWAAALAFYAIFSLAPTLAIVVRIAMRIRRRAGASY